MNAKYILIGGLIVIAVLAYFLFFRDDGSRVAGLNVNDFFADSKVRKLAIAAAKGDEVKVAQLAKDTDVNAVGNDGMTPLLWALGAKNTKGMRALIQAGADPNLKTKKRGEFDDYYEVSPMILAAGSKYPELLKTLLDGGGNPNLTNHLEEPILFEALDRDLWGNFYLLLEKGADINARDRSRETAILRMATLGKWEHVSRMIERGADYALPDGIGATVAWRVQTGKAGPDNALWRDKVKGMLEEHGVRFPVSAPTPEKEIIAWADPEKMLIGAWVERLGGDSREFDFRIVDGKWEFASYLHNRPEYSNCTWALTGEKLTIDCPRIGITEMYPKVFISATTMTLVNGAGDEEVFQKIAEDIRK